jgi:GH15 family glucan-1,4-alpha-glucosidase
LWTDRASRVRELILDRAVHPQEGYFVDAFGSDRLDASLLLLADLGFVSPQDPRYIATVDAIGRVLRQGDHLYRYIVPDDFGTPETSFTICSFWYVDALAATGRLSEARALFEQLLARRNTLGLLSEDVHPQTGELWGNFPQTYSLVGLINAASRLSRSWESLL